MRQDSKFTFQVEERVSNGMGGWKVDYKDGQSFMAHTSPVKAEIALKEYGIVSTSARRLITKEKINLPLESFILKSSDDTKYKILQHLDYKINILLIEVIL
ncbi:hypothetical protein [Sporosarcina beigongshangi]|uniref:hypothetical protein n=1 Tax=Sporosarcina beigongshangi TaxID=2782538 RepID=UPI001939F764|nr:hypothetical protein [Sporosarcina beigongshangi]